MKRSRARDSSSIFFINTWVIIIVVVIVSSLSFTLGYYVGKRHSPADIKEASLIPKDKDMFLNDKEPDDTEIEGVEQAQKEDVRSLPAPQPLQESPVKAETNQTTETKPIENPQEIKKPQPSTKSTTKITYTVQAGAFKSSHEAEILKEKLDKKGYTAYIIQSESKNHERLYKVMIGDFPTRKQAEILSLRIKKSEGLQSFVTFRTKEDVLR